MMALPRGAAVLGGGGPGGGVGRARRGPAALALRRRERAAAAAGRAAGADGRRTRRLASSRSWPSRPSAAWSAGRRRAGRQETSLGLTLHGVVIATPPEASSAIVSSESGPARSYAVGQEIAAGDDARRGPRRPRGAARRRPPRDPVLPRARAATAGPGRRPRCAPCVTDGAVRRRPGRRRRRPPTAGGRPRRLPRAHPRRPAGGARRARPRRRPTRGTGRRGRVRGRAAGRAAAGRPRRQGKWATGRKYRAGHGAYLMTLRRRAVRESRSMRNGRRHRADASRCNDRVGFGPSRGSSVAVLILAGALWSAAPAQDVADDRATFVINLRDADIRALAEQVSEITGRTLILDPAVTGNGHGHLGASRSTQAGVWDLFQSVLRVQGFAALRSGTIWRVIPQANVREAGGELVDDAEAGRLDVVTRLVQLRELSLRDRRRGAAAAGRELRLYRGAARDQHPGHHRHRRERRPHRGRSPARLDEGDGSRISTISVRNADATEIAAALGSVLGRRGRRAADAGLDRCPQQRAPGAGQPGDDRAGAPAGGGSGPAGPPAPRSLPVTRVYRLRFADAIVDGRGPARRRRRRRRS